MKLLKTTGRGLSTAFGGDFEVNWESLGPGLIAVTGQNNAGKTTLLEAAIPGVLHLTFPSYGERFADKVLPGVRDAFVETTFEQNGHVYRALVECDPQFNGGKGKTECRLYRDAEEKPAAGPLQADYLAYVSEHICPKDLLLASPFACQGGDGSILRASKADRKLLFSERLVGVKGRAERHKKAKARFDDACAKVASLNQQLTALRENQAKQSELIAERDVLQGKANASKEQIKALDAQIAALQASLTALSDEIKLLTERANQRALLQAEMAALDTKIAALSASIERGRADSEKLKELQLEQLRLLGTKTRLEYSASELECYESELAIAQSTVASNERAKALVDSLTKRMGDLTDRATELSAAGLVTADELDAAQASYKEACDHVSSIRDKLLAENRTWDSLIEGQREYGRKVAAATVASSRIAGVDKANPVCMACPLARDAITVASFPEESDIAGIADVESQLSACRYRQGELKAQLHVYESIVASLSNEVAGLKEGFRRSGELATTKALIAQCRIDLANANDDLLRGEQADAIVADCEEYTKLVDETRGNIQKLSARIAVTEAAIAEIPALEGNVAGIDGLLLSLQEAAKDKLSLESRGSLIQWDAPSRLDELKGQLTQVTDEITTARTTLTFIDGEIRTTETSIAKLNGRIAQLENDGASMAEVEAEFTAEKLKATVAELLVKGLGADGITALEISVVGPIIAEKANEIIAASGFGSRYRLAIETLAPKADGSGMKEVFDIRIIDTEEERGGNRGGGGLMVIFDEALRLAIALHNAESSDRELLTLVRDETAGALSEENAGYYLATMRKAIDIGGFHQVLFVAHQRCVWEQADVVLEVGNGGIRRIR